MDRFLLPLFVLVLTLQVSKAEAKRLLFASQFSLIPVGQAHQVLGEASQEEFNPDSIKVLVWNIKKGQEKGLDTDLPKFGFDRDLVLLSEGYGKPSVLSIFTSFKGFKWDFGISFLYKKDHNYPTGTMIGSKVAAKEIVVTHSPDLEPIIRTPKALTMGKYPIKSHAQELLVISVHGINLADHQSFVRHMNQALKEIDRHEGPVIFAGDFNTRTKKRITHLFQETTKRGFQSVDFVDGQKRAKGVTPNYLDWAFIRGLKVKNPKVTVVKSSDHMPMQMEVAVE
jgi:endonuclease/exonuclease/phosphatase (EEP) superfamily protein YafD